MQQWVALLGRLREIVEMAQRIERRVRLAALAQAIAQVMQHRVAAVGSDVRIGSPVIILVEMSRCANDARVAAEPDFAGQRAKRPRLCRWGTGFGDGLCKLQRFVKS